MRMPPNLGSSRNAPAGRQSNGLNADCTLAGRLRTRPLRAFNLRSLGCLFVLLALLAAGCGAPAPPGEVAALPKAQVVYSVPYAEGAARDFDQELIRRFEAAHPGVEIVYEHFSQPIDDYLTSAPRPQPDVLPSLFDYRVLTLMSQGLLLDISDLWEQEGWNETYPEQLRTLSSADGNQYFMPTAYTWSAIYYYKPTFDQYNLAPPETWDEFLAVSETLKQNGVAPIALPGFWESIWFDYLNMRLNGPEFHRDLLRGREPYDDPRVRQVFETWQVLLEDDYFLQRTDSYGPLQAVQLLRQGEAGMIPAGPFVLDDVPEAFLEDFDFFRFPIIDPNVPIGESTLAWGYLIAANAPEPEAAMEFLAYLGSFEAQTYLVETFGLESVPTHSGVDARTLSPEARQALALIQAADAVLPFYFFGTPEAMEEKGVRAFRQFMRNTEEIDSVLAELEAARQDAFDDSRSR